jgi:DNA-binding NarL/FixJ family response regulator
LAVHWTVDPVGWTYTTFPFVRPTRRVRPPSNEAVIKLGIVEGESSLRRTLQYWINRHSGLRCSAACASSGEAIKEASGNRAEIWLVDLALEHGSGRECVAQLNEAAGNVCGITYGFYENSNEVFLAPPGGACGYVLKRLPPDRFLEPITFEANEEGVTQEKILMGVAEYFQRMLTFVSPLGSGGALSRLTAREHKILELVGKGCADKEIAARLEISPWTVHDHMKNIFEKLEVHNRTEAVVKFLHK